MHSEELAGLTEGVFYYGGQLTFNSSLLKLSASWLNFLNKFLYKTSVPSYITSVFKG